MPVEDIEFLTKNAEQDSYLFFIDSSQRDKNAFPTVSEYEIRFTEPFSNVYGLEVLDAMIPSTRYTIDVGRDRMKYHLALLNIIHVPNDSAWHYMMGGLGSSSSFAKCIINPEPDVDGYITNITVFEKGTVTIPNNALTSYNSKWKICQVSFVPFTKDIDVRMHTDLSVPIDASSEIAFKTENGDVYVFTKSFAESNNLANVLALREIYVDWSNNKLWIMEISGITLEAFHAINQTNIGISGNYTFGETGVWFTLSNVVMRLEHGNYDIFTFQTYLNSIIPTNHAYTLNETTYYLPFNDPGSSIPSVLQNSVYGNIERQSKYKFSVSTPNSKFILNITQTLISDAIGFSSKAPTKGAQLFYKEVSFWPKNDYDFLVTTTEYGLEHVIITPGVINLNGMSYVILRCPEIESHMYNSFSYSQNCPGIGMFKLGALNQIVNVRFDFVNFIKKPFHPIGKLAKLTFRFETTEGLPYDFKGVDHNMLLSVKFYVPRLKEPKHKFVLNPNYNPNFLEYMIKDMHIDDDQDDDEAEWDKSLDSKAEILQRKYSSLIQEQNEYDYSSEDDDDEVDIMGRYVDKRV